MKASAKAYCSIHSSSKISVRANVKRRTTVAALGIGLFFCLGTFTMGSHTPAHTPAKAKTLSIAKDKAQKPRQ